MEVDRICWRNKRATSQHILQSELSSDGPHLHQWTLFWDHLCCCWVEGQSDGGGGSKKRDMRRYSRVTQPLKVEEITLRDKICMDNDQARSGKLLW